MLSDSSLIKAILDHSPECIVLIGKNHEVLAFNKTIQEVLNQYHHRQLQAGDFYYPDFVVDGAKELYLKTFERATAGEQIVVQHLTENEHTSIWFEYRMLPVYCETGELIGVSLSAKNIDEEKKALIKLAESEDKFKKITNLAPTGILITDKQLNIIFTNYASQAKFGYSDHELRNMTIVDVVQEFDNLYDSSFTVGSSIINLDDALFRSEKLKGVSADGNSFDLLLSSSVYYSGQVPYYIFMVQDITNLLEKDATITIQDKKLREIAWQQSHVIRAPLAKIMGLVNMIQDQRFSLTETEQNLFYSYLMDAAKELDKVITGIVKTTFHNNQ